MRALVNQLWKKIHIYRIFCITNGEEVEFNDDDDLFDHVYDLDQAIKENNALQEQLNKTWYFRIYGTEDKGQNLNEQIKARFQ